VTTKKPGGYQYHVSCSVVHEQLPELLSYIRIKPVHVPAIRAIYHEHFKKLKGPDADKRLAELKITVKRIQAEEADFARLFAHKKLSEANYDILRQESQERLMKARQEIRRLENGHCALIDGLELAIIMLSKAHQLYRRLTETCQVRLLQILFERIIIDTEGRIVDFTLNPPFEYLSWVSHTLQAEDIPPRHRSGSSKITLPSPCPQIPPYWWYFYSGDLAPARWEPVDIDEMRRVVAGGAVAPAEEDIEGKYGAKLDRMLGWFGRIRFRSG